MASIWAYMGVSWNRGIYPQIIHFRLGFSLISHPAINPRRDWDSPRIESLRSLERIDRCAVGSCKAIWRWPMATLPNTSKISFAIEFANGEVREPSDWTNLETFVSKHCSQTDWCWFSPVHSCARKLYGSWAEFVERGKSINGGSPKWMV